MQAKFDRVGLSSNYLVSENSSQRDTIIDNFRKGQINYLFVVDIFNEGIDIPEIDTVLFLRPTESLTVFLQQLGRGLRLHATKDVLTVLDFVGQARDEYNFESKFRALIGKTNSSVAEELKKDFPHLPLGSSIILEKKAKEYILDNIRKTTNINKKSLIYRIQMFSQNFALALSLETYLEKYNLNLAHIYKNNTYTALYHEAFGSSYNQTNEHRFKTLLGKKLMATEALHYFEFILALIDVDFDLNRMSGDTALNQTLGLMLYYDFYGEANQEGSLNKALKLISSNHDYIKELKAYLKYRISKISFEEINCQDCPLSFPLKVHARYNRDQVLVAMGLSSYEKKSSNREGAAPNKNRNTEALFINLKKSEEDFSPTTMYDDYAINETLFHWQSQNNVTPESDRGKSYIHQTELGKTILLFVRESKENEYGFTRGSVFLGKATYVSSAGSRPMSIHWLLDDPIPNYMWQESAKMVVG